MKIVICILCVVAVAWSVPVRDSPARQEEISSEAQQPQPPSTLTLPSNATSIRTEITDNFSCEQRSYGYYADVENECQIFHVCLPVTYADGREQTFRWSFICPEETVFSQESFTCIRSEDMAFKCEDSTMYYELNNNFGASSPDSENEVDPEAQDSGPALKTAFGAQKQTVVAPAKHIAPVVKQQEEKTQASQSISNTRFIPIQHDTIITPSEVIPSADELAVNTYNDAVKDKNEQTVFENDNIEDQIVTKQTEHFEQQQNEPVEHNLSESVIASPEPQPTQQTKFESVEQDETQSSETITSQSVDSVAMVHEAAIPEQDANISEESSYYVDQSEDKVQHPKYPEQTVAEHNVDVESHVEPQSVNFVEQSADQQSVADEATSSDELNVQLLFENIASNQEQVIPEQTQPEHSFGIQEIEKDSQMKAEQPISEIKLNEPVDSMPEQIVPEILSSEPVMNSVVPEHLMPEQEMSISDAPHETHAEEESSEQFVPLKSVLVSARPEDISEETVPEQTMPENAEVAQTSDNTIHEQTMNEQTPLEQMVKDISPEEIIPQHMLEHTSLTVPEQVFSEQTVVEKTMPEQTMPEGPTSDQTVLTVTIPEENMPQHVLPQQTIPAKSVPEQTEAVQHTVEQAVPEHTMIEETMAEQNIPENTVPEQSIAEEDTVNENKPMHTFSEQTIPEQTMPEETIPEPTVSEKALPEQIAESVMAAENVMPTQTLPENTMEEKAAETSQEMINNVVPQETMSEESQPEFVKIAAVNNAILDVEHNSPETVLNEVADVNVETDVSVDQNSVYKGLGQENLEAPTQVKFSLDVEQPTEVAAEENISGNVKLTEEIVPVALEPTEALHHSPEHQPEEEPQRKSEPVLDFVPENLPSADDALNEESASLGYPQEPRPFKPFTADEPSEESHVLPNLMMAGDDKIIHTEELPSVMRNQPLEDEASENVPSEVNPLLNLIAGDAIGFKTQEELEKIETEKNSVYEADAIAEQVAPVINAASEITLEDPQPDTVKSEIVPKEAEVPMNENKTVEDDIKEEQNVKEVIAVDQVEETFPDSNTRTSDDISKAEETESAPVNDMVSNEESAPLAQPMNVMPVVADVPEVQNEIVSEVKSEQPEDEKSVLGNIKVKFVKEETSATEASDESPSNTDSKSLMETIVETISGALNSPSEEAQTDSIFEEDSQPAPQLPLRVNSLDNTYLPVPNSKEEESVRIDNFETSAIPQPENVDAKEDEFSAASLISEMARSFRNSNDIRKRRFLFKSDTRHY